MEYRGWNSFLAAQFTPSLASPFLKADRRAQKIGFTGGCMVWRKCLFQI